MLAEFRVTNYKSFKDEQVLSLIASTEESKGRNSIKIGNHSILKTAVVYGANASGKSNLIKAMSCMNKIVCDSAGYKTSDRIPVTPFLFDEKTKDHPPRIYEREAEPKKGNEGEQKSQGCQHEAGKRQMLLDPSVGEAGEGVEHGGGDVDIGQNLRSEPGEEQRARRGLEEHGRRAHEKRVEEHERGGFSLAGLHVEPRRRRTLKLHESVQTVESWW